VKGSFANDDETLAVGASVRFAVEDRTMFLSVAGKEYKLNVLGVRAATVKAAPPPLSTPPAPIAAVSPAPPPAPKAAAAVPPASPAPAPPPAPKAPVAPPPNVAAAKPAAEASQPKQDQPPPDSNTLDNDAIVKMVVGGLKEDTIVSVIKARPGKYALGPDALAALKAAGVPPSVIAAMSAKMQPQR
jgi:hypothetical protein